MREEENYTEDKWEKYNFVYSDNYKWKCDNCNIWDKSPVTQTSQNDTKLKKVNRNDYISVLIDKVTLECNQYSSAQ